MTAWRRQARELFPERTGQLHRASTLPDLLYSLVSDVRHAYAAQPPDIERRDRVYRYVRWCVAGNQNAARRTVVLERFLLHLATIPEARGDIPALIGKATFQRSRAEFEARLEPADYQATLAAFVAYGLQGAPDGWADA